jgi:hypothetical protein
MALIALLALSAAAPPSPHTKRRWTLVIDVTVTTVNGQPSNGREKEHRQVSSCIADLSSTSMNSDFAQAVLDGAHIYNFSAHDGSMSFTGREDSKGDGFYEYDVKGTYNNHEIHLDVRARGMADGDRLEATGTLIGSAGGACH